MADHQSDIRRQNPDSQLAEHVNQTGHALKFIEVKIIDSADKESERLVKEAWFSAGDTIIHHVDLNLAYQPYAKPYRNVVPTAHKWRPISEHLQYPTVRSR